MHNLCFSPHSPLGLEARGSPISIIHHDVMVIDDAYHAMPVMHNGLALALVEGEGGRPLAIRNKSARAQGVVLPVLLLLLLLIPSASLCICTPPSLLYLSLHMHCTLPFTAHATHCRASNACS
jgi:hypothetical protein